QHWLRAAALYLPVQEGGQGLIHIPSRVAAFHLQAAQHLLYHEHHRWTDVAHALLRKTGGMSLDQHLFTLSLKRTDMEGLTSFYKGVLQTWKTLSSPKYWDTPDQWLFDEPLFFNPLITTEMLRSVTMRSALKEAGFLKIRHLRKGSAWITAEELAGLIRFKSTCLAQHFLDELEAALPAVTRTFLKEFLKFVTFPEIRVSLKKEGWQENTGKLLTMTIPELGTFSTVENKRKLALLNVLYDNAKLAIWGRRKQELGGGEVNDPVLMLRGLIKKRFSVEYAYYTLVNDGNEFHQVRGVHDLSCPPDERSLTLNMGHGSVSSPDVFCLI
ncbi:hypothetical protein QTP86_034855, partial [Hemibagrus guttatus]